MEQKHNILQDIIHEAYRQSQPKKLAEIIKPIHNKVDLRDLQLTSKDFEKLNRLSVKAVEDLETSFLLGLIYNQIFSSKLIYIENLDPDLVLSVVNVLLAVYEKIPGTILARRIVVHIKNTLFSLIKRPELRNEDKEQIFELLRTPSIRQDNIYATFESMPEVKDIKELLKSPKINDKVNALMKLINTLSLCNSIEEQLEVFTKRLPPLFKMSFDKVDEKEQAFLELARHIARIVYLMIFETRFLLRISNIVYETYDRRDQIDPLLLSVELEPMFLDEKEETSKVNFDTHSIIPYKLNEYELVLKSCDNLYPTISLVFENLLKFPQVIEIQRICIKILQRLYNLFPKLRKSLEEPIITVLSNINKDPLDANKKEASAFLYRLIHRDANPEFKLRLENKEEFNTLYINILYEHAVLGYKENMYESTNLDLLEVQTGFPSVTVVSAGKIFTTYIEVWKPMSILYWGFTLTDYDIGFTLTRVASFDQISRDKEIQSITIYKKDKVEASKRLCRGSLIVTEPGIFRLDFDNTHSWFNSKELKYDVFVLEPDFGGNQEFALAEKAMETLEKEKQRRKNTEEPNIPEADSTNVKETIDPSQIGTTSIININQNGIEINIKKKDESYETLINYKPDQTQWERVNEKILESIKQAIQIGDPSIENKTFIKIIYDEKALKRLFNEDSNQTPSQQLISALTCLETLKENIFFPMRIINKIELVIERLLESPHLEPQENLYVICIDNFSNKFYSKFKGKNREQKGFDMNNLCLLDTENPEGGLNNMVQLYFRTQSSKKKIAYLATLLINAYKLQNKEVSQYLIFENETSPISSEENQQALKDIFHECLTKGMDKKNLNRTNEEGVEKQVEESVENMQDNLPEITFCDIKM